jgi:hypothetical protein
LAAAAAAAAAAAPPPEVAHPSIGLDRSKSGQMSYEEFNSKH